MLPTPDAYSGSRGGSQHPEKRRAGGHTVSLADVAEQELLPTPTASQSGNTAENHLSKKPGRSKVTDLGILVEAGLLETGGRLLPTPLVSDSKGGPKDIDRSEFAPQLRDIQQLLPTPNTMEHLPVREGEAYEKHLHRGDLNGSRRNAGSNLREVVVHDLLPTPAAADGSGSGRHNSDGHQDTLPGTVLLMTPKAGDADFGLPRTSGRQPEKSTHLATQIEFNPFGLFKPAIERWEAVLGRPAPAPTRPDGKNGGMRLSPEFTEWMMGVPAGHITNPEIWAGGGLTDSQIRNAQLKACGNGVVPQQAALAVSRLIEFVPRTVFERRSTDE